MIPGQATHAPAPQAKSPLVALLARHAAAAGPPMQHPRAQMQAPGAPMPLSAGGHAAPKFGHAPAVMPGM